MISLLRQSRALLGPRLTGSAEHLGGALRTLTFQSDHPLFHLLDTHAATPSPLDQSPSLPRLAVAGFSAVMLGHHALLPQTALALAELQVGTPQPTSLPAFSPGAEVIDPPAGGADEGMLFAFSDSRPRSFWMYGCVIDLDIAFIDPFGFVTAVHTMPKEAPQSAEESDAVYSGRLKRYPSMGDAQYVLEVAPGTLKPLGVHRGSKVDFDAPALKRFIE